MVHYSDSLGGTGARPRAKAEGSTTDQSSRTCNEGTPTIHIYIYVHTVYLCTCICYMCLRSYRYLPIYHNEICLFGLYDNVAIRFL